VEVVQQKGQLAFRCHRLTHFLQQSRLLMEQIRISLIYCLLKGIIHCLNTLIHKPSQVLWGQTSLILFKEFLSLIIILLKLQHQIFQMVCKALQQINLSCPLCNFYSNKYHFCFLLHWSKWSRIRWRCLTKTFLIFHSSNIFHHHIWLLPLLRMVSTCLVWITK
jgi:hypothetical protein